MKKLLAVLATICVLLMSAAFRFSGPEYDKVKSKILAGALVVDVSTAKEYAQGTYPGAINIPLDLMKKRIADFGDHKQIIVLFSRDAERSAKAKAILDKSGYRDVTDAGALRDMPQP
jgi:phage shock protein E